MTTFYRKATTRVAWWDACMYTATGWQRMATYLLFLMCWQGQITNCNSQFDLTEL